MPYKWTHMQAGQKDIGTKMEMQITCISLFKFTHICDIDEIHSQMPSCGALGILGGPLSQGATRQNYE